jgi:hypothetical protein
MFLELGDFVAVAEDELSVTYEPDAPGSDLMRQALNNRRPGSYVFMVHGGESERLFRGSVFSRKHSASGITSKVIIDEDNAV